MTSRSHGAGEENRTLVVSLGSFCSAIELHPREAYSFRARDKKGQDNSRVAHGAALPDGHMQKSSTKGANLTKISSNCPLEAIFPKVETLLR